MQCSDKLVQQRQAQQRQILAMMGINQWVQPDAKTISIADIETQAADLSSEKSPVLEADTQNDNTANIIDTDVLNNDSQAALSSSAPVIIDSDHRDELLLVVDSEIDVINSESNFKSNSESSFKSNNKSDITDNLKTDTIQAQQTESMKVAPFDLQGGRYGDWILIVDIQALNNDSQKLWQNIVQALSIECETSSFPICVGMDTAELANASLAGYLFKIAQSEDIKVAALTALPKGLTHPNFIDVPTLDAMLENSNLKRQFWQQLSF